MFSALGLVWLSPSTKPHQDQDNRSVHQPDVSCSLPWTRISSRSLERVNLTKLAPWDSFQWTFILGRLHVHKLSKVLPQSAWHFTENQKLYKKYLPRNNPRETQVKACPVRNWMGNEYRLEGPYLFFLCFLFPYCPNWNALWRNINKLVWEVRRTDNCSFISISDRSYLEAISPDFFNIFC